MNKSPSKHLTWKELSCKDGTEYPQKWRNNRAIILAEMFELIRSSFEDKPIQVLSAYRTSEWNKKIGGARNSQHIEGRALDLRPPNGVTVDEFYKVIKELAPLTYIKGIGKYGTFVHIDIRPINHIVYWNSNAPKDSLA